MEKHVNGETETEETVVEALIGVVLNKPGLNTLQENICSTLWRSRISNQIVYCQIDY